MLIIVLNLVFKKYNIKKLQVIFMQALTDAQWNVIVCFWVSDFVVVHNSS